MYLPVSEMYLCRVPKFYASKSETILATHTTESTRKNNLPELAPLNVVLLLIIDFLRSKSKFIEDPIVPCRLVAVGEDSERIKFAFYLSIDPFIDFNFFSSLFCYASKNIGLISMITNKE